MIFLVDGKNIILRNLVDEIFVFFMWSSKQQQQQKIFLKHIRSKSPFAAMEILFLSCNINLHDTNTSPLNFLSIVASDSFLSGLKMVSSTNLRVVILTKINTLPLFILFRMIVDTKCSFVLCYPYIVFFFLFYSWMGCQAQGNGSSMSDWSCQGRLDRKAPTD